MEAVPGEVLVPLASVHQCHLTAQHVSEPVPVGSVPLARGLACFQVVRPPRVAQVRLSLLIV
jgi:hypothetical protein